MVPSSSSTPLKVSVSKPKLSCVKLLTQRIRPVLVVNKVDRALLELPTHQEAFTLPSSVSLNPSTSSLPPTSMKSSVTVSLPRKGTIFLLVSTDGLSPSTNSLFVMPRDSVLKKNKLMERLWGDNYFNPAAQNGPPRAPHDDGVQLERASVCSS